MKSIIIILFFIILPFYKITNGVNIDNKDNFEIKIIQSNAEGLSEYLYTINEKKIKIDSLIVLDKKYKQVYCKELKNKEFKKIEAFIPELLKLKNEYYSFGIDGTYNEISVSKKNTEIKKIIISNQEVNLKDSLFTKVNELIGTKYRCLLLL